MKHSCERASLLKLLDNAVLLGLSTMGVSKYTYHKRALKRIKRTDWPEERTKSMIPSNIKIQGSECQTSGTYAKRAKQATKKDNAAACLCFLNYLSFLRPAADRALFILPWVV
jgi:predicted transcriptional regulator